MTNNIITKGVAVTRLVILSRCWSSDNWTNNSTTRHKAVNIKSYTIVNKLRCMRWHRLKDIEENHLN